ncbi:NAD(P)H-quinone oxidoreductase subunit 5 [Helianthus annuus]|nr:NAD(P)H-quinone oxidoreductase subunit 5 [Helianthus annuus]
MLIGLGLLLFPTATKSLRRMWAFQSVLLLSIVMIFSLNLSIEQINSSSIYQYVWSWIINNDFSLEFGYLIDPLTSIMSILISTVGIMITGSFEFRDLFQIFNNLISNNEVNSVFVTLCVVLLFAGAIAKSVQFPLHVWLPDAMEGPTPISALIHAATMVAAGIFLVARLMPLFIVIPHIMNFISFIGIITVFFGATLTLAQKDIKRGLAYSTMSQLGHMMIGIRYSLNGNSCWILSKKSQNMVLLGGLKKHVPITKNSFLLGTLSLCGIPPLACFWSKDEILNDSWLYSPIFAIITWSTAGFTAFYMCQIYLLTFEGHLNVHFQNYSGKRNTPCIQK